MKEGQGMQGSSETSDPVSEHKELMELKELAPNTPVAPAHGISAIALSMALKYHDIATVQDGALYQQYKLEGRNFRTLNLDHVFETAIRIELHLLAASERMAKVLVDAIADMPPDADESTGSPSAQSAGS